VQAGAVTGPSSRVPLLLVLVWLGGLLVATSVGLLAVRLVGDQVGDPAVAPLSAVAAASAAATGPSRPSPAPLSDAPPSTAPTPGPSGAPSPSAAVGAPRTFTTSGGTLGVQCAGTALRLLYATPAQGYALDERAVSGPEAEVRFEGRGTRVRVRLSCATGAPQLVEQRTDPDGGGDDDDGEDDD
jgi:hypothetical protein